MVFALDHALVKHPDTMQLRRVIYVIPFTSIIEQNAKVFRDLFSELGEDIVTEDMQNCLLFFSFPHDAWECIRN